MLNEDFSEFSYGFAVTSEWIDQLGSGLVLPPEFPSLLREGQTGGGWDVFLRTPTLCTYLQFKLSEHMVKSTAGEYSSHNAPYFRFPLRNRVGKAGLTQHEMLVMLDQQPGNRVLYAAPGFSDQPTWARHYFRRAVLANSAFFSPKELGAVDRSERHCVSFDSASAWYGYLHSKTIRIPSYPGESVKLAPEDVLAETRPLTLDRLMHERDELMRLCGASREVIEKPRSILASRAPDNVEWLTAVYEMAVAARSCLDATLLLVARG